MISLSPGMSNSQEVDFSCGPVKIASMATNLLGDPRAQEPFNGSALETMRLDLLEKLASYQAEPQEPLCQVFVFRYLPEILGKLFAALVALGAVLLVAMPELPMGICLGMSFGLTWQAGELMAKEVILIRKRIRLRIAQLENRASHRRLIKAIESNLATINLILSGELRAMPREEALPLILESLGLEDS